VIRWLVPLVVGAAGTASAQLPEIRLDAFAGREGGAQIAGGALFDAGLNVRLAMIGGAGVARRPGGAVVGVQRAEVVARFLLDPMRRSARGLYFAGGVGAVHTGGDDVRAVLVALVGVEGRPRGSVAPALEAGVGGGARLGVMLRRTRRDRR
jgi:hypothetical protein